MANRDAKKIERTLKDFSLGALSGGEGLTPVNALPEKGNVGTLYKTPDGNIYSWFHEETQKEVEVPPTLKVGKTYQLKEQILIKTFEDSINNALGDPDKREQTKNIEGDIINDILSFNMYFQRDFEGKGTSTYSAMFSYLEEADNKIRYFYNEGEEQPDEYVHRQIIGWTGPTEITVTQEWIDNLSENWGTPFDINNLNFLFVGTTETVTVVNEGYTQLNGIVLDYDKIVKNTIFLDDKNYNAQIIYDTLLRGGSVLLKVTGVENSFNISNLKNTYFEYYNDKLDSLTITFSDYDKTTINVILENQFDPISTIKGSELINLFVQPNNVTSIANDGVFAFLGANLTSEEVGKTLPNGTIITMFEGLIKYDLHYPEEGQEQFNANLEQYDYISGEQSNKHKIWSDGQVYGNCSFSNFGLVNTGNISEHTSGINPTKDYNCNITITFKDGTSKSFQLNKSMLDSDSKEFMFIYTPLN